jgi:hypothetical protein
LGADRLGWDAWWKRPIFETDICDLLARRAPVDDKSDTLPG